MADDPGTRGGDDGEVERPERDRFGLLAGRPWYRHPFLSLSLGGAFFLGVILFMSSLNAG